GQHPGALFHGQPMHMPTGLFNRPKQHAQQPPQQTTQDNGPQSATNNRQLNARQPNGTAGVPRRGPQPPSKGQVYQPVPKPSAMQQTGLQHRAVMADPRTGAPANYQATRNAAYVPPQPRRTDPSMQVMELAARPIMPAPITKQNATPVSPWNTRSAQPAAP